MNLSIKELAGESDNGEGSEVIIYQDRLWKYKREKVLGRMSPN